MTIATDPIQVAALLATLEEKYEVYRVTLEAHKITSTDLREACNAVNDIQYKLDKIMAALKGNALPGTVWNNAANFASLGKAIHSVASNAPGNIQYNAAANMNISPIYAQGPSLTDQQTFDRYIQNMKAAGLI